jgi:hypothetical protein
VFGLATAQIAADILTGEGVSAANTTAWLSSQQRLADGRALDGDTAWQLRAGDLVVVDESSMADTTALGQIYQRVNAAGRSCCWSGITASSAPSAGTSTS